MNGKTRLASTINHADALAMQALLTRLDPSFTTELATRIFKASSAVDDNVARHVLDSVRELVLGPGTLSFPSDDNEKLYANIVTLRASTAFAQLTGNVKVEIAGVDLAFRAREDFCAFAALETLSPLVLRANACGLPVLQEANAHLAHRWVTAQELSQKEQRWLMTRSLKTVAAATAPRTARRRFDSATA